jgi:hypothetical protein
MNARRLVGLLLLSLASTPAFAGPGVATSGTRRSRVACNRRGARAWRSRFAIAAKSSGALSAEIRGSASLAAGRAASRFELRRRVI